MFIRDNALAEASSLRTKADPSKDGDLGAPMKGDVVDIKVQPGESVEKGQVVAVLSAMKMEMAVQASVGGKIKAIHVAKGDKVDGDDLILEIGQD